MVQPTAPVESLAVAAELWYGSPDSKGVNYSCVNVVNSEAGTLAKDIRQFKRDFPAELYGSSIKIVGDTSIRVLTPKEVKPLPQDEESDDAEEEIDPELPAELE
jgi:hypothetical protein